MTPTWNPDTLDNRGESLATFPVATEPFPGIGLHRDVSPEVYYGCTLPSNSLLNRSWSASPGHAHHSIGETSESRALVIGNALHTLVLEGEEVFSTRFVSGGPVNPRTNEPFGADTKAFKEWADLAREMGKEVLSIAEADSVRGMASAIAGHPSAYAHLLATKDLREVSGVFAPLPIEYPDLRMKFRVDGIALSFGSIIDLKTTESAAPWAFERSATQFSYDHQAAIYIEGCRSLGLDVDEMVFISVEKKPPHAIGLYRIDLESRDAALRRVHDLLREWHRCEQAGEFPFFDDDVRTVQMPRWRIGQSLDSRRGGAFGIDGGEAW